MVEERKEEGRGETELVRIKPHMGRKGALNRSHTEQDKKAEEIANDGERQTEDVPTPAVCLFVCLCLRLPVCLWWHCYR